MISIAKSKTKLNSSNLFLDNLKNVRSGFSLSVNIAYMLSRQNISRCRKRKQRKVFCHIKSCFEQISMDCSRQNNKLVEDFF